MTATRELGRSGLHVRPLAFGGNVFGWTADATTSEAILDAFVDGGGNFIDTADAYGPFVSEDLIFEALHGADGYGHVVVATKGAHTRHGPGIWMPVAVKSSPHSIQIGYCMNALLKTETTRRASCNSLINSLLCTAAFLAWPE